jgi:hypothetical protein
MQWNKRMCLEVDDKQDIIGDSPVHRLVCGRDEPPARPQPANDAGDPAGRFYPRHIQLNRFG